MSEVHPTIKGGRSGGVALRLGRTRGPAGLGGRNLRRRLHLHLHRQSSGDRKRYFLKQTCVRLRTTRINFMRTLDRMELKVHGVKCILRVCTEPTSLELLADHENLLQVLSRELRENSKKSFDLSVAAVCVFLTFSHFTQFHPVLMQNQCGDVTMRVLEYESQRAQVRKEDMLRRQMRLQELGDTCTPEEGIRSSLPRMRKSTGYS
ncbi:Hypothetical protein (Fragment) [Durusdinium trenchii]|uniref:Uncharacterized protein n=1 Tax=Durusdinium trenchii TaxID=1381693 RepID=A0ABP0RQI0_9DINO